MIAVIVIAVCAALLFLREAANGRPVGLVGKILIVGLLLVVIISLFHSCSTETSTSKSKSTTTSYVCRVQGCGKTPVYTDWNRRYCSEHINDTSYCRYPGCMNTVPHTSTSQYCSKHK